MNFHDRKRARIQYHKQWKLGACGACNGSGYYDHNGSPKCAACNGSGKEWRRVEATL